MARSRQTQKQRRLEAATVQEANIAKACKAVRNGSCKNLAVAASEFQVNYHTLCRRYKNLTIPRNHAHKNQQLLTDAQEVTVCHWVAYMAMTGHPFSRQSLRLKAGELSEKLKTKGKKTREVPMASRQWLDDFLGRHPDIKPARPTGLDPKRARMFNSTVVNHHFKLLGDFLKAHDIPWENVYNMDEKGVQLGGGRRGDNTQYLYARSSKFRIKTQSENLELVTIIECVGADGSDLRPGIVFSGKDVLREEYFEEEGLLVALSPKGWTSDFIGSQWFEKSFVPQATARNTSGKPILLIYDGHKSHETITLREAAEQHDIHLFCLPPHTTHRLQPLDVGCFGPLQRAWQKRCGLVMEETGEGVTKKSFIREYMATRKEAFKEETIRKAWKNSGINPLNPSIFTEEDYAPSYTTSTILHLPETYPAVKPPLNLLDLSESSDDLTYEPAPGAQFGSDSQSELESDSSDFESDGLKTDMEQTVTAWNCVTPISQVHTSSNVAGPSTFPSCFQDHSRSQPSVFSESLCTQPPTLPEPSATTAHFMSHRKTRSMSHGLSRSATPSLRVSHLDTPGSSLASSNSEQLKAAEERIGVLEEENRILKGLKDAAETHCYFSGQMITHLQKRLETKGEQGKRQRASKISSSARVLTSEEGRAELQQLREQEELKKQKEAGTRAKKAADEQARRERRADVGCIFTGALTKLKRKDELEDLAAALALPETGKKEDLLARIIAHFEASPHLKIENRFKDLFPSARPRKRQRMDNDRTGTSTNQPHISVDVPMPVGDSPASLFKLSQELSSNSRPIGPYNIPFPPAGPSVFNPSLSHNLTIPHYLPSYNYSTQGHSARG